MMKSRTLKRRLLLDLTPLMDVTMILLFGVMVNSVELLEKESSTEQADEKEAIAELETTNRDLANRLAALATDKDQTEARLQSQNAAISSTMFRVLGMSPEQKAIIEEKVKKLAEANGESVDKLLQDLNAEIPDSDVYRALRRIQEMQKVFTFVDLHIDAQDYLALRVDGRPLERIAVRDRNADVIVRELKRTLESAKFSDIVLLLYSYDGRARDRSVEESESAITKLLSQYRSDPASSRQQFRYGRVGLVSGVASKGAP